MRVVPVLYPCDLGRTDRGRYAEQGQRGAPDVLLGVLEEEGVRLGRPIPVPVAVPAAGTDDPPEAPLKLDRAVTEAVAALADVVERVNAEGDFPLILGGDQTALLGQVLGHSRRHPSGIGLAVLADAALDLALPAEPVYDDRARLAKDAGVTETGDAASMVLSAVLRLLPTSTALGALAAKSTVQVDQTLVAGVRARPSAQVRRALERSPIDVWGMERLEIDGEAHFRSRLNRLLTHGPVALSIDVRGIDPDLLSAVSDPVPDGLDWSFLKRTLDQCVPHVDRVLGLDISELNPLRDDPARSGIGRFAEILAPFLRRLAAR